MGLLKFVTRFEFFRRSCFLKRQNVNVQYLTNMHLPKNKAYFKFNMSFLRGRTWKFNFYKNKRKTNHRRSFEKITILKGTDHQKWGLFTKFDNFCQKHLFWRVPKNLISGKKHLGKILYKSLIFDTSLWHDFLRVMMVSEWVSVFVSDLWRWTSKKEKINIKIKEKKH